MANSATITSLLRSVPGRDCPFVFVITVLSRRIALRAQPGVGNAYLTSGAVSKV
jgi:hypothetical protein